MPLGFKVACVVELGIVHPTLVTQNHAPFFATVTDKDKLTH